MKSYQFKAWEIFKRKDGRSKPYRVRWMVGEEKFEEYFATKGLATSFLSELVTAANKGEPFDTITGRPISEARKAKQSVTWLEHSRTYIDKKWPRLAANSRRSTVEALVDLALLLRRSDRRGRAPETTLLRIALRHRAFNTRHRSDPISDEMMTALEWLEATSLPIEQLAHLPTVRATLDKLCVRQDGKAAAATVVNRKRAVFYNALGNAVEEGLLDSNPLDKVQWTAPEVSKAVDRRTVGNPGQVRSVLTSLRKHSKRARRLVAFFGGIYFAGGRPSEVADLRPNQCTFPAKCRACEFETRDILAEPGECCASPDLEFGWGVVTFVETDPRAGSAWTDDGRPNERRGLKHRARKATRPVPTAPEYGAMLYEHLREFPLSMDGRMFYGIHGGPLSESTWDRWWKIGRELALTGTQIASPLMRRAYDLRHAAASLWIMAGVPLIEVARRLGHSLRVLLEVYAHFIDGGDDGHNKKIADALAT